MHRDVPELKVSYQDDPRVLEKAATEDYSLHVAPQSWRSSRASLSMAYLALFSAMFWLVIAATLALAVGTVNTIIGIVLSIIAMGAINYVMSRFAADSGLNTALFSRALFGHAGAALATLILAATAIYFCVFEGSVIAVALHSYVGGLSLNLWYLVVVLYSVPLVFRGVRWLDRFNGFLLPFYVIGLTAAVIWAITKYGYDGAWLTFKPEQGLPVTGPGWMFAFTAYMGAWILMMFTMDYARFARKEDRVFHGVFTFGPVFYAASLLGNGLVGIFLAQTIPVEGGVSEISVVLGIVGLMGLAGVALIWVSQTRINTANFYVASSAFQSFVARTLHVRLSRPLSVVAIGAIVYLIMLTNVFSFILDALAYQGIGIVAWVGVALAHIQWAKSRGVEPHKLEFRSGRLPAFNLVGLTALVVPWVLGIVLIESTDTFGASWAALITFVLAAASYSVGVRLAPDGHAVIHRPYDPRGEVDDPWETRVQCHDCEFTYLVHETDRDPSDGHRPICTECGTESMSYQRAAKAEGKNGAPPEAGVDSRPPARRDKVGA
jgi:purine-cytosine permease-like protein